MPSVRARLGSSALVLLAAALGSCADGSSVARVTVEANGVAINGVESLRVTVVNQGQKSDPVRYPLNGAKSIPPSQVLGLRFDAQRRGAIVVSVEAIDGQGRTLASAVGDGDIEPSRTSEVEVLLSSGNETDMGAEAAVADLPILVSPDLRPSPPVVAGVTPARGPTTGNIAVTVGGSNFAAGMGLSVSFAGIAATNVQFLSDSKLTATLPAKLGAFGKVAVVVTNPSGQSGSNASVFSYFPGILDFSPPQAVAVGSGANTVAVADLDLDGNMDIVVANSMSDDVSVLLGKGNGTFGAATSHSAGNKPLGVVAADFSGDGHADIAVVSLLTGDPLTVLIGLGNGEFVGGKAVKSLQLPPLGAIASADFDGDGRADVVATAPLGHDWWVVDRGVDKGLSSVISVGDASLSAVGVAVGDLNGDGKPDFVMPSGTTPNVSIMLNDGAGGFLVQRSLPINDNALSLAMADFNNDGKIDIVVSNVTVRQNVPLTLLVGRGDGTFKEKAPLQAAGSATWMTAADFNADGFVDFSSGPTVALGNGDGTFQTAVGFDFGMDPTSGAVADFNKDGKPDLVVGNSKGGTVNVILNNSK